MKFKTPKIEKVYEAISALFDDRIEYLSDTSARLFNSNKTKSYNLSWTPEFDTFYSDDNSSKWQHTLGYPIVAILISKGRLGVDFSEYGQLAGIDWNALNKEYKRDYAAVVDLVLNDNFQSDEERQVLKNRVETAYEKLSELNIEKSTKKIG